MLTPTKTAFEASSRIAEHALENIQNDTDRGGYSSSEARTATVQTRQDVAGLIAIMGSVNDQIVIISRGVWLIVALLAVLVLKSFL